MSQLVGTLSAHGKPAGASPNDTHNADSHTTALAIAIRTTMPWFKVDDKLHDHHKARSAGKSAMGVWVLAGSWASANLTDGFVPASVVSRWGTRRDAERLVAAGLWANATHKGEPGWRFRDWLVYNPDARTVKLKQDAESQGGSHGNHIRWHKRRKVVDPECSFCREDAEE